MLYVTCCMSRITIYVEEMRSLCFHMKLNWRDAQRRQSQGRAMATTRWQSLRLDALQIAEYARCYRRRGTNIFSLWQRAHRQIYSRRSSHHHPLWRMGVVRIETSHGNEVAQEVLRCYNEIQAHGGGMQHGALPVQRSGGPGEPCRAEISKTVQAMNCILIAPTRSPMNFMGVLFSIVSLCVVP